MSLFFWKKPKVKQEDLQKTLLLLAKQLLEERKATVEQLGNSVTPSIDPMGDRAQRLYDFIQDLWMSGGVIAAGTAPMGAIQGGFTAINDPPTIVESGTTTHASLPEPIPAEQQKTPKEVMVELENIPVPWRMENLDEKITLLKDKTLLTVNRYGRAELDGLIERLENRKHYEKHKEFFSKFPNTTPEKIDALLKKYPYLALKQSDLFVPEFPKEAIDSMKAYTERVKQVCGKSPNYWVIADQKDFKKKYEKRDPILLVQSPFGFYWQILGAWDEEMVLLTEL